MWTISSSNTLYKLENCIAVSSYFDHFPRHRMIIYCPKYVHSKEDIIGRNERIEGNYYSLSHSCYFSFSIFASNIPHHIGSLLVSFCYLSSSYFRSVEFSKISLPHIPRCVDMLCTLRHSLLECICLFIFLGSGFIACRNTLLYIQWNIVILSFRIWRHR